MSEPLGRLRACSECRLQKLKCDARQDYNRPCSRCRKMGLVCEVSRNIRNSQRKSKAQLARENVRLQEQLQSQDQSISPTLEHDVCSSSLRSVQAVAVPPAPNHPYGDQDRRPLAYSSQNAVDSANLSNPQNPPIGTTNGFYTTPSTLTIDQLGRGKIKACFQLFFEHYEPFIPGLFDATISLDQYFDQSALPFWSMVATGARKFAEDPTLFERVVRQILQIAIASLFSLTNPIPTIEAVLILCLWPIPVNTMFKDSSHALAGVAMQLAVANGLHVFGHEQDFVRHSIKNVRSEIALRCCLWVHCVMIFQNTNLVGGFPYWTIPESSNLDTHEALDWSLPVSLLYEYRLHRIQIHAIHAITQSKDLTQSDCGPPLNSLIDLFDAQVQAVVPLPVLDMNVLFRECTRLSIRAFHFFAAPDSSRKAGIIQLYAIACNVIELYANYDNSDDLALYSTLYYARMLLLAAMSILKISRSELKDHIDAERGEAMYFKAIKLTKKRSTENNDLDARNGIILTQLWASSTIFRKSDGTLHGDRLHLRSRLFTSVIFDTFWHWRATFGGWQSNPYNADGEDDRSLLVQEQNLDNDQWNSADIQIAPQQSWVPSTGVSNFAFQNPAPDFHNFPDWDWAAGLSFPDPMNVQLDAFEEAISMQPTIS